MRAGSAFHRTGHRVPSSGIMVPALDSVPAPRSGFPPWLGRAASCAAVFAWLWFWRAGGYTGGDSEQWVRQIDGGDWIQETQPGVFLLVQSVFRLIAAAFDGTALMAFGLVSCLAGVAAWATLPHLFEGMPDRPLRLLMVGTAGFTTLFYGHLETYAGPVAALLFHLLCVRRSLEGRWPVVMIPLSHALMTGLHLVGLFLLPAAYLVTLLEGRRRGLSPRAWLGPLLTLAGLLLMWQLIRLTGTGRSRDSVHYLVYVAERLGRDPIGMLRDFRPLLKLKFAFWNSGLAAIFLVAVIQQRRTPLIRYGLVYLAILAGFSLVWVAARGEADFDLHSFPWVVLTVLAALAYRPGRGARVMLAAVLAVNAGLWVTRTAAFADLPSRGSATILVAPEVFGGEASVLIDESLRLRPRNPFVPAGGHRITRMAPGSIQREDVEVERGGRYRLGLDAEGRLVLTREGGGG